MNRYRYFSRDTNLKVFAHIIARKISISERNGMCRVRSIGVYYAVVSNMQT